MENVLDRLRVIRFVGKMNQTEFANRLKMAQNTYSHIETGKNPLTDKNISLICLTFGVNENWLRTGCGEMFTNPSPGGLSLPPLSHMNVGTIGPVEDPASSHLAADAPYQDRESTENSGAIIENAAGIYEINPILGKTEEGYPKHIINRDFPFLDGLLHIDRAGKILLFAYSYDQYYKTEEIPFYVRVFLYGKDEEVTIVPIDRIQVQDSDYNKLVMIADVEYNTDSFKVRIIKVGKK